MERRIKRAATNPVLVQTVDQRLFGGGIDENVDEPRRDLVEIGRGHLNGVESRKPLSVVAIAGADMRGSSVRRRERRLARRGA